MQYNYFRDYNPETGRYIESDPIGLRGGLNTYGYVGGDPLSKSDSLGLWSIEVGIGAFGTAFGVDECTGNNFWTFTLGLGGNYGIAYDDNGGPAPGLQGAGTGTYLGAFSTLSATAPGAQLNIFSAAAGAQAQPPGEQPRFGPYYYGAQFFNFLVGSNWGLKLQAQAGGQLTFISPGIKTKNCGCEK